MAKEDFNDNVEKGSETSFITKFLLNVIFFILLLILIFMIYLLYLNIPGSPQELNANIENEDFDQVSSANSPVEQFYKNMKFNHNNISYKMDVRCEKEAQEDMLNAFEEISSKISQISFIPVSFNPDITIICSQESDKKLEDSKHFIAGEGGAKEIIPTGRYNIITNGAIYLYDTKSRISNCNYPNIEIHELMHVFGFDHSDDKNSLMYKVLESCYQKIDSSIINKLQGLYSEENLPDLYIESLDAVKRGRYLDFNITIKNSGSIDSQNISLTIMDDLFIVDRKDLGDIKFGAGITIEITNLKLKHKNPERIDFIIDHENRIEEIDKKNNVARVEL